MRLADWLDEYRTLPTEGFARPVPEPDDWEEQDLLAPADRVPDRSPRWLRRAERVGYGRATHL
ncbi:MAG: hypothetical protein ABIW50_08135 [Candidatus Limnocylindria bacterium]